MKPASLIVFAVLAVSCTAQDPTAAENAPAAVDPSRSHPAQNAESHWSYGDQGDWGETCARGTRQSPIDLREQTLIDEPDIRFAYSSGAAGIFNNGHAIEVTAPAGQTMSIGGETFSLLQAHFHDPSEHRLDGVAFPMEMHLVHRRPDDGLAVVGVLFKQGVENAALIALWAAIPDAIGKESANNIDFDASAFLPSDRIHFEYEGSLTTPPCSEGVRWFVMHSPLEASAEQIEALKARIGENARAVQATNDRPVTEGE